MRVMLAGCNQGLKLVGLLRTWLVPRKWLPNAYAEEKGAEYYHLHEALHGFGRHACRMRCRVTKFSSWHHAHILRALGWANSSPMVHTG